VDGREGGGFRDGGGGGLAVVGWRRRRRGAGDGDDVFETGEVDLLEGVSVEEVEQHGFELDEGGVGFEEGRGEVHERSVTRGGFGSLLKRVEEQRAKSKVGERKESGRL